MQNIDEFPYRTDAQGQLDRLQSELDQLKAHLAGHKLQGGGSATSNHVRIAIWTRRERERLFGNDLFFDPAWDILLELYHTQTTHQRIAISELGRAAAIPPTTTLRWVDKLEESGWVIRQPDPLDRRRVFVELSRQGTNLMEVYFARLQTSASG